MKREAVRSGCLTAILLAVGLVGVLFISVGEIHRGSLAVILVGGVLVSLAAGILHNRK